MELPIPKGALLFFDATTLIKMAADLEAAQAPLRWIRPSRILMTSEGALHQYRPRAGEPTVGDLGDFLRGHGVEIVSDSSAFNALAAMDRAKPRRIYKATDVVLWQTFRDATDSRAATQGIFVSDDGDFVGDQSVQKLYGDGDEKFVVRKFLEVFGVAESRVDATFLRHWISIIEDSEILHAMGLRSDPSVKLQVLSVNSPTIKRVDACEREFRYRIRVGFDCRIAVPYKFPFEAPAIDGTWTTEREALIEYEVAAEAKNGVPIGIGSQVPGSPRYLDPVTGTERNFV
jgi:hypothetical protein